MSFPAVATYSQHQDKASFAQSYDPLDADFFDHFLTFDAVDNEAHNRSDLLESSSDYVSPDTWRAESWAEIPTTASGYHFYSESSGRAAISDSELLSLEGSTMDSPQPQTQFYSLPSSPLHDDTSLPSKTTRISSSLSSKKLKKPTISIENTLRSPIRKSTSSPNMYNKSASTVWEQKLSSSKFNFDLEELSQPVSSPTLELAPTLPQKVHGNPTKLEQDNVNMMFSPINVTPHKLTTRSSYDTLSSTPLLDSRKTSAQHRRSDSMIMPHTPRQEHQQNGWSQVPTSTDFHNSFTTTDVPIWYNHASTAPLAQPSPTALHTNPQRATKSLALQLQQTDFSYTGHGLFIPPLPTGLSPGDSQFVVQSNPHPQQSFFGPAQTAYHQPNHQRARSSTHKYSHVSPAMRQKLPSTLSESESPSPKSHRKRKTPRSSKSERTSQTPQLGGAVDFVNYTPNDSRKILTGVAPSGSSKTKARREREQMDKRRKLSQAAIRAVRAAGGDVESLAEQGLFC